MYKENANNTAIDGVTKLYYAAINNDIKIVLLFINIKVRIELKDEHERIPLHIADINDD